MIRHGMVFESHIIWILSSLLNSLTIIVIGCKLLTISGAILSHTAQKKSAKPIFFIAIAHGPE
jgi:hypothetical protein